MRAQVDRLYLEAAVELARKGLFTTSPNPRVGCLIVRDGRVLGRGWHMQDGQAHAEVLAIANASVNLKGATAYVSLEPCGFSGRTGACTQALIDVGIRRVVVAQTDPNSDVLGKGLQTLNSAGIETLLLELTSAHELNIGYNNRLQSNRPWVRLKCAISMDGRTAIASGESQWVTGPEARADVQYWRARSCATLTGIGTVLADDPALNVRDDQYACDGVFRQPLRVILDNHLRTPASARILGDLSEVRIYHTKRVDSYAGAARCIQLGGEELDLAEVLDDLGQQQVNELMVEAGPTVLGSFFAAGLWDELVVYSASKLLGSQAKPLAALNIERMADAIEAHLIGTTCFGADVRTIYRKNVDG